MQPVQKKATTLAAKALKVKAQEIQIQTNLETLRSRSWLRVTEKVVQNVRQRLTATVATQTENARAAPTEIVEVQVNLVQKVSIATQTEEPENEWVSEPDTEEPMSEPEDSISRMFRLCCNRHVLFPRVSLQRQVVYLLLRPVFMCSSQGRACK